MYLSRQWRLLPKAGIARSLSSSGAHYTTAAPAEDSPIEIPNRIERSPTDLLQALAATVGRDHTAPHYKYHDDPFLIPMSNAAKRTYALSKESGRKAANWIKEEHRELFMVSDQKEIYYKLTVSNPSAPRGSACHREIRSQHGLHRGFPSGGELPPPTDCPG